MTNPSRFTTITEEEAHYRQNFINKSTEYLKGYIDFYENQRSVLRGALEDGFDCVPLDIRVAKEVYQEKCIPTFRESDEIGTNWRS